MSQAGSRKDEIRDVLVQLAARADRAGLATTARDIRDVRLPKFVEERFSLVVIGEFNHGKSTFLNALLHDDILPVGATPTTAALTEIHHGARFSAHAIFEDGTKKSVARADLAEWLRGKAAENHALDRIEIGMNAAFLQDRLTVVDTPGVNDLSEQRADITHGYIPRADAIIFLLDATQVLSASERAFLVGRLLREARARLIFVVAKADLLDAEERAEVERFLREQLSSILGDPPIFFVSAKHANRDTDASDASGMKALLTHLEKRLGPDRGRLLCNHALLDAERLVRFVRQSLGMRRASLSLTRAQLEEKIERARQRLADGRHALSLATDTIHADTAALRARVSQDLEAMVGPLAAALPGEIEACTPADVEAYLPSFLEETFKGWVEREGTMMATTLEALAEKIVTIASEELDAIGHTVARDLGVDAADVQIEAPSFSLEASVFALGMLGTTALVFVNTLMGGMVALLTPALAALVRARAAQNARQEAARRAPDVVRKLAVDVLPRLDRVIDDFGERLEAFLAEAGAALSRGITEVLQSAMDARLVHDQGSPDKVAAEIAADLQELDVLSERIAVARR